MFLFYMLILIYLFFWENFVFVFFFLKKMLYLKQNGVFVCQYIVFVLKTIIDLDLLRLL